MRIFWMFHLTALILAAAASRSLAQPAAPLDTAIDQATTIIAGTLEQYIAEPEAIDRNVQERMRKDGVIAGGNAELMVAMTINPRGTYVFTVDSTLKGTPQKTLAVRLPRITAEMLGGRRTKRSIPLKARYLLMLSGSSEAGYAQVYRGPIEISKGATLPKEALADQSALRAEFTRILLESMELESALAGSTLTLVKALSDPRVVDLMRKHIDDPDDGVRAAALECLARNQDVSIIPRIAAWKYSAANTTGNPVLQLLGSYTTPDAVPFLNQLLLDTQTPYVQQNAVQALRKLPLDKSTIPFWFAVFDNPQASPIAVYGAYHSLHTMNPALGAPANARDFAARRDAEVQILRDWWAAEQTGKETKPDAGK